MTNRARGNVCIAIQFALLVAIFVIPRGAAWPLPAPLAVLSFVAIAVGAVAAVVALISLGKSLSANPVPVELGELKTAGVYRVVRHPVYTGIMIGVLGYTALSRSWGVVAAVVALGALFALKARFEEKLLLAKYPDYLAYAAHVGRFVPGIGMLPAPPRS